MFLGHFAVGFASKRLAPRTSLGLLLAAPLLLDLLWPFFVLAGWETVRIAPGDTAYTPLEFVSYPFSHSLAAVAGWAALFALAFYLVSRDRRGAFVIAALVLSHWFLDLLTHRPDLPLYPGGPRAGLGLWNSVPGTVAVELLMLAAGVGVYLAATRPRDRAGRLGLWSLVVCLALLFVGNSLGPPPPDVRTLNAVSFASWLFPLWGGWADRHRDARGV